MLSMRIDVIILLNGRWVLATRNSRLNEIQITVSWYRPMLHTHSFVHSFKDLGMSTWSVSLPDLGGTEFNRGKYEH